MSRRRSAKIHLPPLSSRQALIAVAVLERAIAAIWRAHGDDMAAELNFRDLEARARKRGFSCADRSPERDFTEPL